MAAPPVPGAPLRTAASALRPHWALIAALGLFLLTGLAAIDDYGVSPDENTDWFHASATADYVLGNSEAILQLPDRTYGMGFRLPLAFAERPVLDDIRALYLVRHLVTHLFFLAGGLFAYLLALRLFSGRPLALVVALLFLLHPRLYVHSFVNAKDIPFLVMFIIALFLAHWAFKRDNLWVFALLGAGVGMLMNIRVVGALLIPAILAMRGFDLLTASGPDERKRVMASVWAFVLAGTLTLYTAWPYLWGDAIGRFVESFAHLSQYDVIFDFLFRGTTVSSSDPPAGFIAVWFSITAPPHALLLGCIGALTLVWRGGARPRASLRNTRLRFGLLLVGSFAAPIAAVILLRSTLYNDWRHLYFLWAPFSLLAAFGLHWLSGALPQRRARAMVYGAAGIGVGAVVVSMALLHPNQQIYFNFIEDRVTQDRLIERYVMDYYRLSLRELHRHLLNEEPSTLTIQYRGETRGSLGMLTEADRERISVVNPALADFSIRAGRPEEDVEALRVIEVYNNALFALVREQPGENPFPAIYEKALSLDPIVRSGFDLYALDRMLIYVKEPCESGDLRGAFFLRFYPAAPDDLPEGRRWAGYEEAGFRFLERGALFDGKCVALAPLPDYPVLNVQAYQFYGYANELYWEDLFPLDAEEHYAAYEAAAGREPDARAAFDLHLNREARTLTYVKEPCALSDVERKFFLHIAPERVGDLPSNRREHGFDNLDFAYLARGVVFDGKCVAVLPLPNYAIERIRTGQFERGEGEVWEARLRF